MASLTCLLVSLYGTIHSENFRKVKGLMYGALGIFVALPCTHLILREYIICNIIYVKVYMENNLMITYLLLKHFLCIYLWDAHIL